MIDSPASLRLQHGRRTVRVEHVVDGDEAESAAEEFDLDGLADDERFQQILRTRRIKTIHSQEATLEQAFIQITGKSLT